MKAVLKSFFVFGIFLFLLTASPALSGIINFTIEGNYADALSAPDGTELFAAGESFSIFGQFDDTLQPTVEQRGVGSFTYTDINVSFPPVFEQIFDYSQILSLVYTNLDLSELDAAYPSSENALNDGDLKTGSYIVQQHVQISSIVEDTKTFQDSLNYTGLTIQESAGIFTGYINYNYRKETRTEGEATITQAFHDTIALNITSFEISGSQPTEVPEPTTILLFGLALAGIARQVRKRTGDLPR